MRPSGLQDFPVMVHHGLTETSNHLRVDSDGGVGCPATSAVSGDIVNLSTVSFRPDH